MQTLLLVYPGGAPDNATRQQFLDVCSDLLNAGRMHHFAPKQIAGDLQSFQLDPFGKYYAHFKPNGIAGAVLLSSVEDRLPLTLLVPFLALHYGQPLHYTHTPDTTAN
jgi:hypothetical protein